MLEARAAETLEPQPFFKTRVMAAIRESRAEQPAFLRLWRSAGALFAAMLMVVVLLSTLSLFTNPQQDEPFESNIAQSEIYPENIVFDDEGAADDEPLSYAQVLDLVFDSEDSDGE
jgi:peptidoglycan/LPS O-acetylase OafA/YrhL